MVFTQRNSLESNIPLRSQKQQLFMLLPCFLFFCCFFFLPSSPPSNIRSVHCRSVFDLKMTFFLFRCQSDTRSPSDGCPSGSSFLLLLLAVRLSSVSPESDGRLYPPVFVATFVFIKTKRRGLAITRQH